jgi:hypothetical protein
MGRRFRGSSSTRATGRLHAHEALHDRMITAVREHFGGHELDPRLEESTRLVRDLIRLVERYGRMSGG